MDFKKNKQTKQKQNNILKHSIYACMCIYLYIFWWYLYKIQLFFILFIYFENFENFKNFEHFQKEKNWFFE